MQLVHRAAARRLMQAVDVLGDDGLQLALPLQLMQHIVDVCAVRDGVIQREHNFRCIAHANLGRALSAQIAACRLQTAHDVFFLLLIAEHADICLGIAQITGHFAARHRNHRFVHARVFQGSNGFGQRLLKLIADAFASLRHKRSSFVSNPHSKTNRGWVAFGRTPPAGISFVNGTRTPYGLICSITKDSMMSPSFRSL